MKTKTLLFVAALFVLGLTASLALASPSRNTEAQTTTTTNASEKPKCAQVELKGNATSGSVAFTATKANKSGQNLVGKSVTLAIPAGASVKAKACVTGSTLTLRLLHVKVDSAKGKDNDDKNKDDKDDD
jgi:predicted secreted protein